MAIRELAPDEFPEKLLEIPQPPKKLWLDGSLPDKKMKTLAVVGSRALSPYGREAEKLLIAGLAGYPISIISGLALGADTVAHEAALDAGLHTLAIPGSGLGDTVLYPHTNLALAKRILKNGGGLLSEHPADYRAQKFDFPSRNRIMVGLADAVLIVEAGEKSGTLITARLAADYNRELLCIPHRLSDAHGFGANLFIRLGATLVSESIHILEALNIDYENTAVAKELSKLEGLEKQVYELLTEPKTRDELLRAFPKEKTSAALTALMSLELQNIVHEKFNMWRRS